jgi:S-adenosylmethionine hydrolase
MSQQLSPSVFLFTDFGADSVYTGQMRGVLSRICPDVNIQTLTNTVPRQNTAAAAFLLSKSLDYLPAGAHVLCVVDPGVGSDRPIVCLRTDDPELTLLGPDNGMFARFEDRIDICRQVTNDKLWLDHISNTFHGRDVMSPTLAHVAAGTPIQEVGPPHDDLQSLHNEQWFTSEMSSDHLSGYVIYADVFGNLITSISESGLRTFADHVDIQDLNVQIGDYVITGIESSYSAVPRGESLAIISSADQLEVAVNQGSATEELHAEPGDQVIVRQPE